MKDSRQIALLQWLNQSFSQQITELIPLSGDAGFRRYFRFSVGARTYLGVDSPSDKCNNASFVDIQHRLCECSLNVPTIYHYEPSLGFFCLEDLGEQLFSDALTDENMVALYRRAIGLLPTLSSVDTNNLPEYDEQFVHQELTIFSEWLVQHHCGLTLTPDENNSLQRCFDCLVVNATEQPQVFMHRDFHSRNIMLSDDELAIIDFQDAVKGPVTYDIVSLLRDCYVKWPQDNVNELFNEFIRLISPVTSPKKISVAQWRRWFDLMGVQRHVKASGIFARLHHRDNKSTYLADIPLTLSYIIDVCTQYQELHFLAEFVEQRVLPKVLTECE